MTRQLEAESENRAAKRDRVVLFACNGGLLDTIRREGGMLEGLSFKFGEYDCLLTLRAEFPAGRRVCFIGGDDLAYCIRKAYVAAQRGNLRWKQDKFAPSDV